MSLEAAKQLLFAWLVVQSNFAFIYGDCSRMPLESISLPWNWTGYHAKTNVDVVMDMVRGFSYNISGHR